MATDLLVKGLILGFSIAAPVGPIGVLCIRRTLVYGRLAGLASGMGAATADAFYGCLAAAGFGLLLGGLEASSPLMTWLRIGGGLFLLYLAVATWRSRTTAEAAATSGGSLVRMYLSTLALTLTNPLTIISFAAVFAGFGVSGGVLDALVVVVGVFAGSALWWVLLSGGVSLLRGALEGYIPWINRLSALIIFGFAVAVLMN